jgi:hypothetical protein
MTERLYSITEYPGIQSTDESYSQISAVSSNGLQYGRIKTGGLKEL